MRHCHSCDCQLSDEHERCLHCGGELHDAPRAGGDEEAGADGDEEAGADAGEGQTAEGLVLLTSMDPFESRRLLDRLAEAGIPFAVLNDEAARRASRGRAGGYAGVNVFVPPDQRAEAGEIQQAVLRESLPDLPEDFEPPPDGADGCPACAAPLAGDAQRCEECGLEFPDVSS